MKNKHTAFFYIAIAVIIIAIGVSYYHYTDLQATIQDYINAGYDEESVRSYYKLSSLIPSVSTVFVEYGIFATLLFIADGFFATKKDIAKISEFCDALILDDECGCEDDHCDCGCEDGHEDHCDCGCEDEIYVDEECDCCAHEE